LATSPFWLLQQALALHQAGRLDEAQAAYRQVLATDPRHADAWHYLGVLLAQRRDQQGAIAAFGKALAVNGKVALVHFHMAESLRVLGRYEEALASYDRAIALEPDFAQAHDVRAGVLSELRRFDDALAASTKVLALAPQRPEGHFRRGNALLGLGNAEEALKAFDLALTQHANNVIALNGRGCALQALGRAEEAAQAFQKAALAKPDFFDAFNNLGNILGDLGRHEEAIVSYRRALTLNPGAAETCFNLGSTLMETNRLDAAAIAFDQAVRLDPTNGLAASQGFFTHAELCDWSDRTARIEDLKRRVEEAGKCNPFALLGAFDEPALHLKAAKTAAITAQQDARTAAQAPGRLRIAYLSADFHDHPVAHQIVELLEQHDRSRFEIFGVCLKDRPVSAKRQRLKSAFEHFLEAGKHSDADTARLLAEAGINIAIDLSGLTRASRPKIFALRPAPIAVNYLGYSGTLGAEYIDYILADSVVIPPSAEAFYSEQVVRLPSCFMPSDSAERDGVVPSRQEEGLPPEAFVFCGFNNAYKVTPEIFAVWMDLLKAVEKSILWLNLRHPIAQENLHAEAARRGVDRERLVFAGHKADRRQHLARLRFADLFLDTQPYGGHATACDMLRAGVPVVTVLGRSFAARVGASLVSALDAPELIASDLGGYEKVALDLAHAPQRLAALREKLRRNAASRFDMVALCRSVEAAYCTMWQRHAANLPPQAFSVTP